MESSSAMASASPTMEVEEELKCPICMEYLTDPVTLDCGHNFCRACINNYCEKWEGYGPLQCPLCKAKIKRGNFRPNWQLANIAEKIKSLSLNLGKEHLCVRHKEKLNLFCKDDQELVCVSCETSPKHQSHTVLLMEEAAKECMDQLCSNLEDLRKERERILASQAGTEKESRDLLGQIEEKKTSTVAAFNQLHQFLEEQKTFLLLQLEELEKEIATRREEHMARLMEELSSLEGLFQQMEEKCQQPAIELLQDIRRTLQSYEKKEAFKNPVAFPLQLSWRIRGFRDVKPLLEGVMKQLKQVMKQGLTSFLNPSTEASSAMAAASPPMDAEKELQCPICMEILTDPGTLDCGHNFCRGCISQYCETWEDRGDLECPVCKAKIKKGNFQRNYQLANIVEKVLSFKVGKEDLCAKHKEKLSLFCKEDQELVCIGCERSPAHLFHTFLHLEDAARECKDQLCSCLEVQRKERERILEHKAGTEKESQDLLGQINEKKTRTVAAFNRLYQFLEERKTLFLLQLEELEQEIATRREEHMARLKEEQSFLEGLILHMEEKCQQPASELLQDIRKTLQRSQKKEPFGNPVAFPPELTCRVRRFCDVKPLLERVKEQFPANVTLDPDTAHPNIILSEDLKSVRWGHRHQALQKNPERFDSWPCVLGREGFTAGTHFWEVTVGGEGGWAVGVARKSVRRKRDFAFSSEKGIWAVGKWGGQYKVISPPDFTPLSLSQALKRIRVTLNCAEGQVSFSEADSGIHLYTCSGASFCGEIVLPFFYVRDETRLTLSP